MASGPTTPQQVALVNGVFCRMAGPETAPPVFLLHGFADSGLMFAPLFDTPLSRSVRLIAVDLPGFGVSPPRGEAESVGGQAQAVVDVIATLAPGRRVGLVAHSVASMIAVEAARHLGPGLAGLFSFEGNLTDEDAYFSGRAADHGDARAFKESFLDAVWAMAQAKPILRRYFAGALMADARAMWTLGRDAKRLSPGDAPGRALQALPQPVLYYWSPDNAPEATRRWLGQASLAQMRFGGASHWPTIDQPRRTGEAVAAFLSPLLNSFP